MTEQDSKNLFTVSDYIEKCWGLKDEDLAYLKQRIFNPVIAPEYKNLNFDENFRAIYDIDIKKSPEFFSRNDRGWNYFCSLFNYACIANNITYVDYLNNKKTINKNEVKLKKILENFYKENFSSFLRDVDSRVYSVMGNNYTPSDIEKYIIKAFELIGIHKPKQNGMKLVISFNYADWLLCSTGETWSSCLDIQRGAYWKGIASIFGDDNRALLYVTSEGKKKSWDNIRVDSFIARAWVFLNNKNQKVISKFYPTEPINIDVIKNITEDNSFKNYNTITSPEKGKYELAPIRFRKDGIYVTPYNDIVRINTSTFFRNKKLEYEVGVKGGAQYFNCNSFTDNVNKKLNHYGELKSFYKSKKTLNSEFRATTCDKCHSTHNIIDLKEFGLCTECITEDYGRCEHCGGYHLKEDLNKKVQGITVCDTCYEQTFECDICGEVEFKENHSYIETNGKEYHYCQKCKSTRIVICEICGISIIKGINDYHREDKHYCENCIKEDKELLQYKTCKECRALLTEEEAIVYFFENYYCDPCLQKERDKKQIFFNFN